jgi:hypothetical protein
MHAVDRKLTPYLRKSNIIKLKPMGSIECSELRDLEPITIAIPTL